MPFIKRVYGRVRLHSAEKEWRLFLDFLRNLYKIRR